MFVRFQFASTTFAEMVRDQLARSDVGCIPPTSGGFVVERIEFPAAGATPMDVDRSGDLVLDADVGSVGGFTRPSRRSAGTTPAGSAAPVSLRARPDIAVDVDVDPDPDGGTAGTGTVPIRIPIHVLDTIFGAGYETITVPVQGGAPIEVRRQRLLLTLPTFLRIRLLDDMIAGSPGPALLEITIALQLRVDLVHGTDGVDRVRVAFHGVGHFEDNDPNVEAFIRQQLAGTDTSREVQFDYAGSVLAALAAMSGGGDPPVVVWSGMSLSTDRNTVEMRLEVDFDGADASLQPDEWRRFLTRQFDVFRGAHDWAVELTNDLVDRAATLGAKAQIQAMSGDFRLAGTGPHVEWRPDFPGLRTTFTGEVIDACSCFGFDIDVNVAIEVKTVLRLAQGGASPIVEVDSVMGHDATHAGEQACCFVSGVALFPILGWKYLADGKIGWGGLALGMFVPILGSIIVMATMFDAAPELELAPECRKEGDHQICSYPVSLSNPPTSACDQPTSTITIDELRGRNNGLVLAGSVQQRVASPPQVVISKPTPFDWQGPRPTCEGPVGEWSAFSEFEIAQVDGGYPLVIGEIFGVSFTGGLYKPEVVSQTDCPTIAHVRVGTLPFEAGNPFNGSILVLTNVGAHMVTVPPVPPLTPEEKQAHERFVSRWQTRFCNVFDLELLSAGGQMAVRWLVDEAADGPRGIEGDRRLWVVRAFGLDSSSTLVVDDPANPFDARDADGGALAEAVGVEGRATRVDVLHGGDELQLSVRGADGSARSGDGQLHVSVAQLLLREVGTSRLAAPATDIRVSGPPSALVLEAELDDGAEVVGLSARGKLAAGRRTAWTPPLRPARPAPEELQARAERAEYRAATEPVRYRDRAWTDGLAFAGGGVWARLDDDRQTVRTYKVVDSLVL
jgi:hypothetical protein